MREGLRLLGSEQEEMGKGEGARDKRMGVYREMMLFRWLKK